MKRLALFSLAALVLGGCVTVPRGPSVMVLPGAGKPFEQFQADDASCRQWAYGQSGAPAANPAGGALAGAAIGTVIGGAAGAALGAIGGNPGLGAAVGAGVGAVGGTATGANAAGVSSWEMQRRYDFAYQQCMYAKGNQVPGIAARRVSPSSYAPPPPPPPPPPGAGQRVPTVPSNAAIPPPDAPPPPPPVPR